MLKDDHLRVQELFARFDRTHAAAPRERLATAICNELKVHAQLEEEIFYPAVRAAIDDADLMNEAEVEHASAKDLIAQIERSSASDERYAALVTVLGEYIKHHVKEEHEEMFPKVRRSELDLASLGERMRERKRALVGGTVVGRSLGRLASLLSGPPTP